MKEDRCKGCGAKVVFAQDESDNWQILDPSAPVYHVVEDDDRPLLAKRATPGRIMVSHFKTCPKATDFSRAKRQGEKNDEEKAAVDPGGSRAQGQGQGTEPRPAHGSA